MLGISIVIYNVKLILYMLDEVLGISIVFAALTAQILAKWRARKRGGGEKQTRSPPEPAVTLPRHFLDTS